MLPLKEVNIGRIIVTIRGYFWISNRFLKTKIHSEYQNSLKVFQSSSICHCRVSEKDTVIYCASGVSLINL